MELGLYLGDAPVRAPKQPFFLAGNGGKNADVELGLGFCIGNGLERRPSVEEEEEEEEEEERRRSVSSGHPSLQLDLIPLSHATRKSSLKPPWNTSHNSGNMDGYGRGGLDVNMIPSMDETDQDGVSAAAGTSSSPNSGGVSSFQMDLSIYRTGSGSGVPEVTERASSRASDDEENNGSTRKKLRLSKEQSAYLEESFKEHNTPNPKQKLALADKLNLRPRQVEVWFQNRRARTKLKQTEVDCEYLKKCCEKLTEDNRRLQKELQELRALKSAHPYYMHVPATTLTMCPSCERIASATGTGTGTGTTPTASDNKTNINGLEMNPESQKTDSPWSSFLNPFWHQQKNAATTTTTRQQHSAAS